MAGSSGAVGSEQREVGGISGIFGFALFPSGYLTAIGYNSGNGE